MSKGPKREAGVEVLPPLHAKWARGLLPAAIPVEKNATCGDCAMCAKPNAAARGEQFYSPDTKCCTFLPALANFLVGGILSDRDRAVAAGRRTVERRIAEGIGVTPLGLGRGARFGALYRLSPTGFGHAKSLLCPHFLEEGGGTCGVWRHRESTCSTWFCKFERGETGRVFWHRLHDLFAFAETCLAFHCVLALGVDAPTLARLVPSHAQRAVSVSRDAWAAEDVDGTVDRATYAAMWGSWLGREGEFYEKSARIVAELDWPDVAKLGGAELAVLERLTLDAYERLVSKEIPERLERRPLKVLYASRDRVNIVGYSPLDPLSAPKALVDALHCFDGGSTEAARERVSNEHDLRLTDSLLRKLADFGFLGAPK